MKLRPAIDTLRLYRINPKEVNKDELNQAIDSVIKFHSKGLVRESIRKKFIETLEIHGRLSVPEISKLIGHEKEQVQYESNVLLKLGRVERKKGQQKSGRTAYLYNLKK